MVFILSNDFDWEVKVKSAQFWTGILRLAQEEQHPIDQSNLTTFLEQQRLFAALMLGLTDYETSVQAAFKRLLFSTGRVLPRLLDLDQPKTKMARMDEDTRHPRRASTKHRLIDRHEPDYLEEDVDSVIEDIVMSKDRSLVAELEQKMSSVSFPAENGTDGAACESADFFVENVTFAQLRDYCRSSLVLEEDEALETAEARLESVLDDILQSVEGVSLVETVDCY